MTGGPIVELDHGPKMHGVNPSADVTMVSAAEIWSDRAIGIVFDGG